VIISEFTKWLVMIREANNGLAAWVTKDSKEKHYTCNCLKFTKHMKPGQQCAHIEEVVFLLTIPEKKS
jgi:hypothetical protein